MRTGTRLFALLTALALCLTLMPGVRASSDFTVDGNGVLTGYAGAGGSVTVPQNVVSVGANAFKDRTGITAVTVPDGVLTLEGSAFEGCAALTSVTLPRTLKEIGDRCFAGCTSLTTINVPEGVTHLSGRVFLGCEQLESVFLPSTLRFLGTDPTAGVTDYDSGFEHIFANCPKLTDITYAGTQQQWNRIVSGPIAADALKGVTLRFEPAAAASDCTVSYYANGGKGVMTAEVVAAGNSHTLKGNAFLRDGYTFVGWAETPNGEVAYEDGHALTINEDLALYAVWISAAPVSRTVSYDANGGKGTMSSESIKEGSVYTLRRNAFVRDGHVFSGWATEPDGEKLYNNGGSAIITGDVTFYAVWTSVDANQYHSVTLDGNGGAVDLMGASLEKVAEPVRHGESYTLPENPFTREGYVFSGWSLTENGVIEFENRGELGAVNDEITLYAIWSERTPSPVSDFSYSFGNYHEAFGYSAGYRIPLERYHVFFGDTAQALALYNIVGEWDGNCYGMSSTASLIYNQTSDVNASDFRSGAARPLDLRVGDRSEKMKMTLKDFIETMQISQLVREVQEARSENTDLNQLCSLAANVRTSGEPVMVSLRGRVGSSTSGHSVLAYALDEENAKLMIYDPSFPDTERFITLTGSPGSYTGWSYCLNDKYDWGTGKPNSELSYVPYSVYWNVWNGRDGHSQSPDNAVLTSGTDVNVYDRDGRLAASLVDGKVLTDRADIIPLSVFGGASGDTGVNAVWLPAGCYTVKRAGGSGGLEVGMASVDQSVTVTTTADAVSVEVDDAARRNYVHIDAAAQGGTYSIALSSTLESDSYGELSLRGTARDGEDVTLSREEGATKLDGANADDVRFAAERLPVPGETPGTPKTDISGLSCPFADVKETDYFRDPVVWAYHNGVTNGVSPKSFAPFASCTRGEVVTFLWRAMGCPEPENAENRFIDVSESDYYYKAVLWAVERGITAGTSPRMFSPKQTCSTAHIITFLYRAVGAGTDGWYEEAMAWARGEGLFAGTCAAPASGDACPRCDVVTFLFRKLG